MRNWVAISVTLIAALVLTLLPMPGWTAWLRPAWVLMVLIYWTMTMPHHVNVGTAWIVGVVLDVLTGTMLGEHALALTIVIYLVYSFHRRIRMYPMLQQGFSVLVFVLLYQFIQGWRGWSAGLRNGGMCKKQEQAAGQYGEHCELFHFHFPSRTSQCEFYTNSAAGSQGK